jgi:hypothetical protein
MCNPVAAGVIGLVGGAVQGIGAAQGHETNAQSYELQAEGLSRDIKVEKYTSAFEIAQTRKEVKRTLGNQRAGFAANGLALSGSAAEVALASAEEGDLDVEMIRWNSRNKVAGMKYQRDVLRWNAGQERAAAPLAFFGGVLGGAARFGGSFG